MTDLAQKGSVPVRYWILWWSLLGAAVIVFYVLLTPIWIGLRLAAWGAEFRARRHRGSRTLAETREKD